jgi:hypothetical protein
VATRAESSGGDNVPDWEGADDEAQAADEPEAEAPPPAAAAKKKPAQSDENMVGWGEFGEM